MSQLNSPVTRSAKRYILLLLTITFTVNYIDRQILSILIHPIKQEFSLSDTQVGFMSGFTFAIFYVSFGIPLAYMADKGSRKNLIAGTLFIFSSMTAVCGLAQSFGSLLLARIGVAVGEAGTSPSANAIISDLYPPEERSTAMGVYSLGVNIGVLIGFLIGGWINQWYGWRATFLIVGLPGIVLALIFWLTVKEPVRGASEPKLKSDEGEDRAFFDQLKAPFRVASYTHVVIGTSFAAMSGYAAITWTPVLLARSFGMNSGEIGTMLALSVGIIGGLGTYVVASIAERLGRRQMERQLYVILISCLIAAPSCVLFFLFAEKASAPYMFVVPAFTLAAYLGPAISMSQSVVALRGRAMASALLTFLINLIGLGAGPQLVGILSDRLSGAYGGSSLRYALAIAMFGWIVAAFHFWRASMHLNADMKRAVGSDIAAQVQHSTPFRTVSEEWQNKHDAPLPSQRPTGTRN